MHVWTTFCPSKICWELTYIETKGKKATGNWLNNLILIENSLKLLKTHGITGIRLVIYPSEITRDGKRFDWEPIHTILKLCAKHTMAVDLCVGPFQFPNYPGIYLPVQLVSEIPSSKFLDTNPVLKEFGLSFLKQQMEQFAQDKRLHGFHLANEWPDMQRVSGKESIRIGVSETYMLECAKLLKKFTTKPIVLNTNIDASFRYVLSNKFTKILTILGPQGSLGFDIYPSQETWEKAPLQKFFRLFQPYPHAFAWSQKKFSPCEMTFVEVEAQPWGNGQSWYQLIKAESHPNQGVRGYFPDSLQQTWQNHITNTSCNRVSLWGADFWLSTYTMGITWPMQAVKNLSNK